MSFSERHGLAKPKLLQVASVDADLNNGLWQALSENFLRGFNSSSTFSTGDHIFYRVAECLYSDFFKLPSDQIPSRKHDCIASIRQFFFGASWNIKLDLIEFCGTRSLVSESARDRFVTRVNFFLEREKSAYRFIGSVISQIVDPVETESVEQALRLGDKHSAAKEHLKQALAHFSHRSSPDYRNAIKEAISAVEATCRTRFQSS